MKEQVITKPKTTFQYEINESLHIGDGYYLYIYANSSDFGTAQALNRFNIISGLENHSIQGLPPTLYIGPTLNITLPINNTRSKNITLTVSMEADDIYSESQLIELPTLVLTNVSFNLTARFNAAIGPHKLIFKFKQGNILYLEVVKWINIGHSFDYRDFFYKSKAISGDYTQVYFNLINFLPNSTQSLNVSLSGQYVQNIKEEINLLENEVKSLYYDLLLVENIIEEKITVIMEITKGKTIYYSLSFDIEILPEYEIISVSFPKKVSQGETASFILIIQNNKQVSEAISLYVNGEKTLTGGLSPGENRIVVEVIPTIFPYDFFTKTYQFLLKDNSEELIAQYYFEVTVELSPTNLVLFYFLPVLIPIGIILFYKNKEIKHKLLRR